MRTKIRNYRSGFVRLATTNESDDLTAAAAVTETEVAAPKTELDGTAPIVNGDSR